MDITGRTFYVLLETSFLSPLLSPSVTLHPSLGPVVETKDQSTVTVWYGGTLRGPGRVRGVEDGRVRSGRSGRDGKGG